MTFTIIATGSIKERYFTDALSEYEKRIGAYGTLKTVVLKEAQLPEKPSDAEIRRALQKEADQIRAVIPARAYKIALCVEGKQMSSEHFSAALSKCFNDGYSDIVFFIGSSFGLDDSIKQCADLRLSFSQMTFPHQLMRVILAEQLYRALNIAANGKYHK